MNKAQENAIERIKLSVESYCDKFYEIKEWEIDEYPRFVSLIVVTGVPNDEGTMASILARDHAHFFIGPRGGITYPVYKDGVQKYRPYKFYLDAVVKQRR